VKRVPGFWLKRQEWRCANTHGIALITGGGFEIGIIGGFGVEYAMSPNSNRNDSPSAQVKNAFRRYLECGKNQTLFLTLAPSAACGSGLR
jgi:hypothetical protein